MNHNKKNEINVLCDNQLICTIDSDSPSLVEIVNKIILNESIDISKLKCKTNIENFDSDGLTDVLVDSIKSIKSSLTSNINQFEKVINTIRADKDIEEFYESLKCDTDQ